MRNLNLDLERCFPESYWDTQQDVGAASFISSEKEATDELARVLLSAGADPADVASGLNHYFRRVVELVLVPGCDLTELTGHLRRARIEVLSSPRSPSLHQLLLHDLTDFTVRSASRNQWLQPPAAPLGRAGPKLGAKRATLSAADREQAIVLNFSTIIL